MEENSDETMSKYELKKLVNELEDIRGRNTELVSLYIPAGYDMSKISEFVTSEASEAENIKSKHTRKNVQAALDKIGRKVKEEQVTPENGVAFFAGNVSEREGRPEYKVWEVLPPRPIESRRYRCDKEFLIEPLKQMIVDDRVYGLIAVDKNEAAVGYLQGSSIKTEYTLSSEVPGKTRAGGQCLDPDTLVQMSDGDMKKIEDIEPGDYVKSADFESMQLVDSKVKDKWNEKKQVFKIETKFPRKSLIASEDHEVFTTQNGVERKKVGELKEGQKMILPEKIDTSGCEPHLETQDCHNSYILSENARKKIREKRSEKNYSQKELGENVGVTQTAVSKIEKGERNIKTELLKCLCDELEIDFNSFTKDYCTGTEYRLPSKIDSRLAQILGYFAGDGSFDPERINFHEQDEEVAEFYRKLLEKVFGCNSSIRYREDKNYYNLRAFGKPIVKFIRTNFPEIKKSHDTEIPDKILKSESEILSAFIRGFYDAEGSCSSSRKRVSVSANNRDLIRQIDSGLLRLGIVASVEVYDNSENPYSDKKRYSLSISDQKSIKNFAEKIGFTSERKIKEVEKILEEGKVKNNNRQILMEGEEVRKIIEEHGKKMEDFRTANTYLQGEREISKKAFTENFIEKSEGELKQNFESIRQPKLTPVKIKSIEKLDRRETVDISVESGNFLANNLVVHNSAQRFARHRKQMLKNFMDEVAEKAKKAFLQKAREDKLLGVIIGGPGWVKDKVVEQHLHQELKEKIVANESLNYSGEEALEELVSKAEDAIEDSKAVIEKNLVKEFFKHLKEEDGKAEYGIKHVEQAMNAGAVETALISEDANLYQAIYRCSNGHEKEVWENHAKIKQNVGCDECNEEMDLEKMEDVVDVLGEKAKQMGSEIEIISTDHEEGQRLLNMSGIAAILRYRIR